MNYASASAICITVTPKTILNKWLTSQVMDLYVPLGP